MNKCSNDKTNCFIGKETHMGVNIRLPIEDEMYDLAELFKCFGDSTRVRILCVLLQGEFCVGDIAEALNMTQSAVSHQLKLLKQAKLIAGNRDGKQIVYSLADDHVRSIINIGLEHIEED
ncbi:MAG: winged helix-turn-helix transcriptional regulator [Lachnospiraceae bacterium]|nr:winged helix-turn-helix transcriptional regulator [Lachnospiraceae bacterium]